MVRTSKILIGFLGGLLVCLPGRGAEPPANPYLSIVERNVFHLNPPPAPPDPEANKPPPPKVFLTGITTIMGSRRALLKTLPPTKPGEPPKEKAYMLAEHERLDDLEVIEIDEIAGTVKVVCAGVETTVNFKDNGVASTTPPPPAVPVPGPGPGFPGAPGARTAPGLNPAFPAPLQPGANQGLKTQFPPRPVRGNEGGPGKPGDASNRGAEDRWIA